MYMYMAVYLHVYKCLLSYINIDLFPGLEHSKFYNGMSFGIGNVQTFASVSFPKVNQI